MRNLDNIYIWEPPFVMSRTDCKPSYKEIVILTKTPKCINSFKFGYKFMIFM